MFSGFELYPRWVPHGTRVCITVENFPNPTSVFIRICKQRKKVFYCFYKITFKRKKAKLSFFRALIKREILTSREVLRTKLVRVISPCFAEKDAFQNTGFFKLSAQAKKKLTLHVSKDSLSS